jgi:hypothetical protein
MRSVRVGFLFGVLSCASTFAADLVIGPVPVRLGMPEAEALAVLGKAFDVKQVSVSEGKYLLWTREPETKTPYSAGSVSFRDGKLYRASKTWATAGVKNVNDAAAGLFAALSSLGCQKGRPCQVQAETRHTPANLPNAEDVDLVTIDAPPDRKVFVKIWKPHAGGNAMPFSQWSVEEFLMESQTPR